MKSGFRMYTIFIGVMLFSVISRAQDSAGVSAIKPFRLYVGTNATSNLIFPHAILSVDRGSAAVLAQKAKGVENILQLKAAFEKFPLTNLTVITTDGRLYSFIVDFDAFPNVLNWRLNSDSVSSQGPESLAGDRLNDQQVDEAIDSVRAAVHFLRRSVKEDKMKLQIRSLYICKKQFWLSLVIRNHSYVDFEPESIRLFVQDRKKIKRTASQQFEVKPFKIESTPVYHGESTDTLIIGIHPLMLPSTQRLVIQIREKGGRLLRLLLSNRLLLRARRLDESDR